MFTELVNRCAFGDKVTLNLNGNLRRRFTNAVRVFRNVPIGAGRSAYSRVIDGQCVVSGNPIQLKYVKRGKFRNFDRVPDYRLTLRSETRPLSAAEVAQTVEAFMCAGVGVSVGQFELTFDIDLASVDQLDAMTFAKSARRRLVDAITGKQTLYIGTPHSGWQARIYQKTDTTSRVECILRPTFLAQYSLKTPQSLLALRSLPLLHLLSFKSFSDTAISEVFPRLESGWKLRALRHLAREPEELSRLLRRDYGVNVAGLLVPAAINQVLRRMQAMFFW